MSKHFLPIFLLCFFITFYPPPSVKAANAPPEDTAKQVQKTYDQMESLRFQFSQHTSGEMTGRPQQGIGWATFLRKENGQKMRWQYSTPDEQVILSDGQTLFMYFKKLQQMITTPADQLKDNLTYAFFIGQGDLTQDFEILPVENQFAKSNGNKAITLIPRTLQQQVASLQLRVTDDHLISQIRIEDHFGTITTLDFNDIEVNALEKFSQNEIDKLFSFIPPAGTEILEQ